MGNICGGTTNDQSRGKPLKKPITSLKNSEKVTSAEFLQFSDKDSQQQKDQIPSERYNQIGSNQSPSQESN